MARLHDSRRYDLPDAEKRNNNSRSSKDWIRRRNRCWRVGNELGSDGGDAVDLCREFPGAAPVLSEPTKSATGGYIKLSHRYSW